MESGSTILVSSNYTLASVFSNPDFYRTFLKTAIHDYLAYPDDSEECSIAKAWLFSADGDIEQISFSFACNVLSLRQSKVRLAVNMMKDKRKNRLIESEFETLLTFAEK